MAISRLNIFCLLIVLATGVLVIQPVLAETAAETAAFKEAYKKQVRADIEKLASKDPHVRHQAEQRLITTFSSFPGTLPDVSKLVNHSNSQVRESIVRIIAGLGRIQTFKGAVPAFKRNLKDKNKITVINSLYILATLNEISKDEALKKVTHYLKTDPDPQVTLAALHYISTTALKRYDLDPSELLASAYDNKHEEVRYRVIDIMSNPHWTHFKNAPNVIFQTYIRAVNDPSTRIRLLTVELLANYHFRKPSEVKKVLTEKLKDSDVGVRAAAIAAWASVVDEKFPSSANPVDILQYKDEDTIVYYIYNLKRLKLSNEQNRKLVQFAYRQPSPKIKAAAISQLISMLDLNNPKLWEQMVVVINASDSPDLVKTSAINALVSSSKPNNPYLQDVITKLAKSRDHVIRDAALNSFGHFALDKTKMLTEISQLIESKDKRSQNLAVVLISKTGVSNTKTTKKTVSFLGNEKYDQEQVVAAVKTLSRKNNLQSAVPGLVNVLQNIRMVNSPLPESIGYTLNNILQNAANPPELLVEITDKILRQWRQAEYPVYGEQIYAAISKMTFRQKYDLQKYPRILEKLCSYYTYDRQHRGLPYSNMVVIIRMRVGDSAIDPLINMLSNSNPEQRACAADALGSFRYWARRAMPALEKLTKDKDQMVSSTARKSLETIEKSPREVKANLKVQTVNIKTIKNNKNIKK